MTDEVIGDAIEIKAPEPFELMKQLEEKEKELMTLRAHQQALLEETKKAKAAARAKEEEKLRQEEDHLKSKGHYEQLYKSANSELEKMKMALRQKEEEKAREITNTEAMRLAAQIADGHNVELLSEFIKPRLKFEEGMLNVLNAQGEKTISTLDQLRDEFASSEKFKSLVRGKKASGGSASGSGGSAASVAGLITAAEFDKLNNAQRMEYSKTFGRFK